MWRRPTQRQLHLYVELLVLCVAAFPSIAMSSRGRKGHLVHRPPRLLQRILFAVGLAFALATLAHAQAQWTPNGLPVCVTGCAGTEPRIASDGFGGTLIAWQRNPGTVEERVYVQRVLG